MKNYFNTNNAAASTTEEKKHKTMYRIFRILYRTFCILCLLVIVASLLMSGLFIADRRWQTEQAQAIAQVVAPANGDDGVEIDAPAEIDGPWYHEVCAAVGTVGRAVNNNLPDWATHLVVNYEVKDGAYRPEGYQNYIPEF